MTELERQVNQGLDALDEAHRRGKIARDDYRARRRHLLRSLCDMHATTGRYTLKRAARKFEAAGRAVNYVPMARAGSMPTLAPRGFAGWRLAMLLAGIPLLAALLYWLIAGQ
jgi:hypothetical protein